jgi:hypothetical protein
VSFVHSVGGVGVIEGVLEVFVGGVGLEGASDCCGAKARVAAYRARY